MSQLISIVSRVVFIAAFLLAGLAAWEKLANLVGYTLLRGFYSPFGFLQFSVVGLLFVIAVQLREVKDALSTKGPS
jgi:uncharacterized membrane protein YccC